jgi:hypothetical protein
LATALGLREVRRDKRKLDVRCQTNTVMHQHRTPEPVICVRAVNDGRRPVELISVRFWMSNGDALDLDPMGGTPFPVLLGDGQGLTLFYEREILDAMAEEKRAIIRFLTVFDASGSAWGVDYPLAIDNAVGSG